MSKCNICPRKCNIDRSIANGFCGSNDKIKIGKVMLHKWEEPILAKEKSGAIFFSNCPLKCVYCQNYEISQNSKGKYFTVDELVDIIKMLESKGAENIDLVSPTQYTEQIIEALKIYKPKVPVVWNSNGYEDVEVINRLKDYVDIYLPDFKYASDKLSLEYSKCKDYFEKTSKAILKMRENCPEDIYEGEKLKKGVIVRHLVLPNHFLNTKLVLNWIKKNLGKDTTISVMGQYTPYYLSENYSLLSRKLNNQEYKKVCDLVFELGFENGFLQDLSSADECYIPDFEENFTE